MKTIKCKECGKILSKKAKICPNCGCGINWGKKFLKIFLVILIIFVIILGLSFVPNLIKDYKFQKLSKKYSGTWDLKIDNDQYYQNDGERLKILLDKELIFGTDVILSASDNVGEVSMCIPEEFDEKFVKRCPESFVRLYSYIEVPDIVYINFIDENGSLIFIKFKYSDETLKQTSCHNGEFWGQCVDEKLKITYEKK